MNNKTNKEYLYPAGGAYFSAVTIAALLLGCLLYSVMTDVMRFLMIGIAEVPFACALISLVHVSFIERAQFDTAKAEVRGKIFVLDHDTNANGRIEGWTKSSRKQTGHEVCTHLRPIHRIDHDEHGCTRESWAFGRWADVESLRISTSLPEGDMI